MENIIICPMGDCDCPHQSTEAGVCDHYRHQEMANEECGTSTRRPGSASPCEEGGEKMIKYVYNGEDGDIRVVTALSTIVIPGKAAVVVEIPEGAAFTGYDIEIYNAK